jgi:hypothetical protein
MLMEVIWLNGLCFRLVFLVTVISSCIVYIYGIKNWNELSAVKVWLSSFIDPTKRIYITE